MKTNQFFKSVIGALAITTIIGASIASADTTPTDMVLVPGGPFVI
jgi:hypothetical protein